MEKVVEGFSHIWATDKKGEGLNLSFNDFVCKRLRPIFFGIFSLVSITSANWVLDWAQEFEEEGLPSSEFWSYETGYVRNNEDQYYTREREENARVENGHLVIEVHKDNYQNNTYTSASIHTSGKKNFQYGRFELRAKINISGGSWPAWWTVGTRRGWPTGGEIDMMEYYRGKILFNTYCGDNCNGGWDTETQNVNEAWADSFHVWRMDWDSSFIRLYVDDELMNETDLSNTFVNGNNPFREPHYMIVNQALGGNNGGTIEDEALPFRYEVDYIRVYKWDPNATSIRISPQELNAGPALTWQNGKMFFQAPRKAESPKKVDGLGRILLSK